MALDAATLAQIRDWVGSTPDDDTVELTYERGDTATVHTTALAILRKRRADLLANPASFKVEGDYSQDTGKNLEALESRIGELLTLVGGTEGSVTAGQLTRPCRATRR